LSESSATSNNEWVAQVSILRPGFLLRNPSYRDTHSIIRSRHSLPGGLRRIDALHEKISKKGHPHRDLSTALRSGRDDKGEGGCGPPQSSGFNWNRSTLQRGGRLWSAAEFRVQLEPVDIAKGRAVVVRRRVQGSAGTSRHCTGEGGCGPKQSSGSSWNFQATTKAASSPGSATVVDTVPGGMEGPIAIA